MKWALLTVLTCVAAQPETYVALGALWALCVGVEVVVD